MFDICLTSFLTGRLLVKLSPTPLVMWCILADMCALICSQGTLTLLNVETGTDSVTELEAIGAFVVMLLLTEDVVKGKNQ